MKLSSILTQDLQFKDLIMSAQGIEEALIDIVGQSPSYSTGPIEISREQNLLNGYHRVVEAMLNGKQSLPITIVKPHGSYPLGTIFKVTNEPLQGLEHFIEAMDDDQWQSLSSYPLAREFTEFLGNNL